MSRSIMDGRRPGTSRIGRSTSWMMWLLSSAPPGTSAMTMTASLEADTEAYTLWFPHDTSPKTRTWSGKANRDSQCDRTIVIELIGSELSVPPKRPTIQYSLGSPLPVTFPRTMQCKNLPSVVTTAFSISCTVQSLSSSSSKHSARVPNCLGENTAWCPEAMGCSAFHRTIPASMETARNSVSLARGTTMVLEDPPFLDNNEPAVSAALLLLLPKKRPKKPELSGASTF
mmetsp:Transcript_6647/g.14415  ORF Transcript_6647/g.14415 Transcript_6647/m.14415 type:complete len:229 (-) Transcript_6647:575-1261(-)